MKLNTALQELESFISKHELVQTKVSKATIGWQIAHSLKVCNGVIKTLSKSNPKEYKWKFNLSRTIVFTLNHIPRGSGKAPKAVKPTEEELSMEELGVLLEKVRTRLAVALKGDPNTHFDHPYFGVLNLKGAIKFMEIHTEHHLKIIRDIAKATK